MTSVAQKINVDWHNLSSTNLDNLYHRSHRDQRCCHIQCMLCGVAQQLQLVPQVLGGHSITDLYHWNELLCHIVNFSIQEKRLRSLDRPPLMSALMSPKTSDLVWVIWQKCLVGSKVVSHPLAGVGTLPFSGGMLMPPFGLPPGARIVLVLNQWRLNYVDGWVGQRCWLRARSVTDKRWWRWPYGLRLHSGCFVLILLLLELIFGYDLVQHCLIGIDLLPTGANNLPPFVLHVLNACWCNHACCGCACLFLGLES